MRPGGRASGSSVVEQGRAPLGRRSWWPRSGSAQATVDFGATVWATGLDFWIEHRSRHPAATICRGTSSSSGGEDCGLWARCVRFVRRRRGHLGVAWERPGDLARLYCRAEGTIFSGVTAGDLLGRNCSGVFSLRCASRQEGVTKRWAKGS